MPSWVSPSIRRDLAYSEDALLILTWAWTGYLPHHLVEIEARRFLSRWKFFETLQPLRDQRYSPVIHVRMVYEPLVVEHGRVTAFERVGKQVEQLWYPEFFESQPPDVESFMVLFDKDGLPSAHPEGEYIPVITPIEETLARRFLHLSFEGCSRRGTKRQLIAQVTNP